MAQKPSTPDSSQTDLDQRKASILEAVVAEHVDTAQPVGSSSVTQNAKLDVSPATVRSEMVSLERQGYLAQPHTSAGRVPTDKGYRYFVDHLKSGKLGAAKQRHHDARQRRNDARARLQQPALGILNAWKAMLGEQFVREDLRHQHISGLVDVGAKRERR